MSALSSGSGVAARLAPVKPKTRGFLHIVRHGGGASPIYIVKYHRLDPEGTLPKPLLAEGAHALFEFLQRIGVDFRLAEGRGALGDILLLGSTHIPHLS